MKYVLALALAFGISASAQAATPATHNSFAATSGVASGTIKTADMQTLNAKDTKKKKKKKKKA